MESSRKMNGRFSVGSLTCFSEVFAGVVGPQQIGVEHTEAAQVKQVLETFREMKISGSTGIPVFAGFRESDAWWDSSFRSSGRPGSRP